MESGGLNPITDWDKYEEELLGRLGNDNKMVRLITNRAKIEPKELFCRGRSLDVLKAIAFEEGICHPILLGVKEIIRIKRELVLC
jgi:malate dehydrogenase (oxaloacetate-decarboxylating)(NADP+)